MVKQVLESHYVQALALVAVLGGIALVAEFGDDVPLNILGIEAPTTTTEACRAGNKAIGEADTVCQTTL